MLDPKLTKYLAYIRKTKSINLARQAKAIGCDFWTEIRPALASNFEFREAVQGVLEEIKYDICEKLQELTTLGRSKELPEPASLKQMIALIDSGVLLPQMQESINNSKPENVEKYLAQLDVDKQPQK